MILEFVLYYHGDILVDFVAICLIDFLTMDKEIELSSIFLSFLTNSSMKFLGATLIPLVLP